MKTFLFASILLLVTCFVQAQQDNKNYTTLCTAKSIVTTADTVIQLRFRNNYAWRPEMFWTLNTGTTSAAQVVESDNGTTWSTYPNISSFTITGATGNQAWEDSYFPARYIGLKVDKQVGQTLKLTVTCTTNFQ